MDKLQKDVDGQDGNNWTDFGLETLRNIQEDVEGFTESRLELFLHRDWHRRDQRH
jgi:hypothetical protein